VEPEESLRRSKAYTRHICATHARQGP
jgi:hypothetical protein